MSWQKCSGIRRSYLAEQAEELTILQKAVTYFAKGLK
ncbi:hypothetical protein C4A55_02565 [Escherichia coli]|nr:hypothetical protein C4A55_02565 [Escherichia coli]